MVPLPLSINECQLMLRLSVALAIGTPSLPKMQGAAPAARPTRQLLLLKCTRGLNLQQEQGLAKTSCSSRMQMVLQPA